MTDTPTLPDGDYAVVALFGHTQLVGRIAEVNRFGTTMIQIEPVFRGALLGPVWHGGAAIYGITPIPRERAAELGATSIFDLPHAMRLTVPSDALPPPASDTPLEIDWSMVEPGLGRDDDPTPSDPIPGAP